MNKPGYMSKMGRIEWGRVQWIAGNAQRAINLEENELNTVPLEELEQADESLGHLNYNEDYRLLIRNRIEALKRERDIQQNKRFARSNVIIGLIGGIAATLIGVLTQHYLTRGG